LALVPAELVAPARPAEAATKPCRTVVKNVRGTLKRVRVCRPADLRVTVTASPRRVTAGNEIVVVVQVSNGGPGQARNVTLTIDAGSASPAGTFPFGGLCLVSRRASLVCPLGTLDAPGSHGGGGALPVRLRARDAGRLRVTVRISSSTRDPNAANNAASASVEVASGPASADLSAVAAPPSAPASMDLGLDDARSLRVSFAFTGPVRIASISTESGPDAGGSQRCTIPASGAVSCTLSSLESGGRWRVYASGAASRGGTVTASVTASSATPDPNPGNNAATATVTIG
jgi:hypothetical protein